MKWRALELFGCSGGMALGFRRAGIEFEVSIDADPLACASYFKNLGRRPLQMDVRDLAKVAQFVRGHDIDLLVADPPCTPYSRAGKRQGLADKRDMLATTADLLERLRPRTWLIGNVPGLDDGPQVPALQATLGELSRSYCIDYASLDAAAYGVPQHRVRPFWFGHPRGTRCITWPQPTHGGSGDKQLQIEGTELLPYVTVRDALGHLPTRQLGERIKVKVKRTRQGHPPSRPDHPAGTITTGPDHRGGNVLEARGRVKHHRPSRADRPARTLTRNTHSDGALIENAKHRLSELDAPSHTIVASNASGANGARAVHWPMRASSRYNAVKLSEKAACILQGFPDGWQLVGDTKTARWSQLGQAMPPALAEAVARAIVTWWFSLGSTRELEEQARRLYEAQLTALTAREHAACASP